MSGLADVVFDKEKGGKVRAKKKENPNEQRPIQKNRASVPVRARRGVYVFLACRLGGIFIQPVLAKQFEQGTWLDSKDYKHKSEPTAALCRCNN
ncbi:MAG: hypothetical protein NTW55_05515 [Planctomycetota bacterium]|nr:hypothetical protein [Planctomycetota bacterium]